MVISAIDVAWAAGFIEGEGSFGHPSTACVRASQVQREPLERLQRILGGSIRLTKRNRNNPRNENSKDIWTWVVYGQGAASAIMSMLCLLSPWRYKQAIDSLNFWKNQTGGAANFQRKKTHCKHGHEFTVENTRLRNGVHRVCKECHRINTINYRSM